jgi:hypothetical protein
LRKLAEEKGVQDAKEASGHKSDRSIWRYVKPSQQSLAAAPAELQALQTGDVLTLCVDPAALSGTGTAAPFSLGSVLCSQVGRRLL